MNPDMNPDERFLRAMRIKGYDTPKPAPQRRKADVPGLQDMVDQLDEAIDVMQDQADEDYLRDIQMFSLEARVQTLEQSELARRRNSGLFGWLRGGKCR